jgi:undecaprenyl diphosphate synthase
MTLVDLNPDHLPGHIAIIMDGNGRWAMRRGLPRIEGHRRGKESVRAVVETARRLGIRYLSLYAFSTENWGRPADEVTALMRLLERYLNSELQKMMRHEIRLLAIGNLRRLPRSVQVALRRTVEATRQNTGMTVILAVSYGGREEITAAVRAIAREVDGPVIAGLARAHAADVERAGEAVRDAAALDAAGVPVTMRRYDGMIHGFVSMPMLFPEADEAVEGIGGALHAAFATR